VETGKRLMVRHSWKLTIPSVCQKPSFRNSRTTGLFGVPTGDPATPLTPDEQLQAEEYQRWRVEVSSRLNDANRWSESVNFAQCGSMLGNFQVLVCDGDVAHEARAIPFTCHLRYCPDCEKRHQATQVAKYTPVLKDLSENSDKPGWSLKKIELTTPYRLADDDASALFQDAWEFFEHWLQLVCQHVLKHELTPAEIRRQRVSLKAHGIGALAAAEFGEHGHRLHFHVLIYSPFIPKQTITDLWREASGGECEVNWIRKIDYHDVEDAVREQVKYVTKFSQLDPALVVKLADVLDGARRLRTYGVVRGATAPEPEPHVCATCSSAITIMRVREYFERCIERNISPDPALAAAAAAILLDLKRGNNSGEGGEHLARSDPADLPKQADMPGFDAVFTPKKPFQYH
jgi:hypothetical protein